MDLSTWYSVSGCRELEACKCDTCLCIPPLVCNESDSLVSTALQELSDVVCMCRRVFVVGYDIIYYASEPCQSGESFVHSSVVVFCD